MGAFTLLMGQQRAKLMLSEMENKAEFFDGDSADTQTDAARRGSAKN